MSFVLAELRLRTLITAIKSAYEQKKYVISGLRNLFGPILIISIYDYPSKPKKLPLDVFMNNPGYLNPIGFQCDTWRPPDVVGYANLKWLLSYSLWIEAVIAFKVFKIVSTPKSRHKVYFLYLSASKATFY